MKRKMIAVTLAITVTIAGVNGLQTDVQAAEVSLAGDQTGGGMLTCLIR